MKPQQPNVDWCRNNRELVMRWLERRGGWQVGDWCIGIGKEKGQMGYVARWQLAHKKSGSHVSTWVVVVTPDSGVAYVLLSADFVWLPTEGDMLEMLDKNDTLDVRLLHGYPWAGQLPENRYKAFELGTSKIGYGETRLIALMELLKGLEGENNETMGR